MPLFGVLCLSMATVPHSPEARRGLLHQRTQVHHTVGHRSSFPSGVGVATSTLSQSADDQPAAQLLHVLGHDRCRSLARHSKAADRASDFMTDTAGGYYNVGKEFAAHGVVDHGKDEYVRGKVRSNTVEGYFAILKRGIVVTFYHVSERTCFATQLSLISATVTLSPLGSAMKLAQPSRCVVSLESD